MLDQLFCRCCCVQRLILCKYRNCMTWQRRAAEPCPQFMRQLLPQWLTASTLSGLTLHHKVWKCPKTHTGQVLLVPVHIILSQGCSLRTGVGLDDGGIHGCLRRLIHNVRNWLRSSQLMAQISLEQWNCPLYTTSQEPGTLHQPLLLVRH